MSHDLDFLRLNKKYFIKCENISNRLCSIRKDKLIIPLNCIKQVLVNFMVLIQENFRRKLRLSIQEVLMLLQSFMLTGLLLITEKRMTCLYVMEYYLITKDH